MTLINKLTVLLSAVFYCLYSLLPFKNWLRLQNYTLEPFPNFSMYQDSTLYLGQIREVINGNYLIGNPFFFENSTDGLTYLNSSLFFIWGSVGRLLGINLIHTYLLMILINSVILIILLNLFYSIFTSSKITILISLFTSIFLVGPLGRPSPTQQLLPILIIAIILILNQSKNTDNNLRYNTIWHKLGYLCCSLILATGSAYYNIFLFSLVVIISVVLKKIPYFYFSTSVICSIVYLIWTRIKFDSSDELIATRLGLHHTRIPGALSITLPLLLILSIILILNFTHLVNLPKDHNLQVKIKLFFSLNLALLISLNSQIFTGIAVEMESHYRLVWYVVLGVFFCIPATFITNKLNNITHNKYLYTINTFVLCIMIVFLGTQFEKIQLNRSERSILIDDIKYDKKIKSVLIKKDSKFADLSDEIILLTDKYLYWEPNGVFSRINQNDIISRFSCTQTRVITYEEFLKSEIANPSRAVVNSIMKEEKYRKLLNLFGIHHKPTIHKSFGKKEYEHYVKKQIDCLTDSYQFRVDKVIR
jgi:hypothetical protein